MCNNNGLLIIPITSTCFGQLFCPSSGALDRVLQLVVRFTRARLKDPLNYSIMGTLIPEASSCKYLRIILRCDLSWAVHVNYTVKKAWKALHFTIQIIKKGNSNTKSLAYMSLVRPILEYGTACWDPYRVGQIIAIDRAQKRAA